MSIVKYFTKTGDENISKIFTSYVWKEHGLDTVLDKHILHKEYGNDLSLLLIQYYVEGKFEVNGPEQPKVSNYSRKNKDIAVAISVSHNQFHDRNEFERREFIVDSTLDAIHQVRMRLKKKKLDIDFDKLIADVRKVAEEYLKYPEPYSKM